MLTIVICLLVESGLGLVVMHTYLHYFSLLLSRNSRTVEQCSRKRVKQLKNSIKSHVFKVICWKV